MCMCFFAHKNIIFDKITAILTLTFQTLVSSIDWMCWGSWMRMGQGVGTGLGHGGITCVLQTQFSSYIELTDCTFWSNSYSALKNRVLFRTSEKLENFSQNQNDHSFLWHCMSFNMILLKWSLWNRVYEIFPEKISLFQKIWKLQNLVHWNKQGITCIEIQMSQTLTLLQNAAKELEFLGHWQSNLWAIEMGIYYSNVYGEISFAPLTF